jgi:hypothetical protein
MSQSTTSSYEEEEFINYKVGESILYKDESGGEAYGVIINDNNRDHIQIVIMEKISATCERLFYMPFLSVIEETAFVDISRVVSNILVLYEECFDPCYGSQTAANPVRYWEGLRNVFCIETSNELEKMNVGRFFSIPSYMNATAKKDINYEFFQAIIKADPNSTLNMHTQKSALVQNICRGLCQKNKHVFKSWTTEIHASHYFLGYFMHQLKYQCDGNLLGSRSRTDTHSFQVLPAGSQFAQQACLSTRCFVVEIKDVQKLIPILGIGITRQFKKNKGSSSAKYIPVNILKSIRFEFYFAELKIKAHVEYDRESHAQNIALHCHATFLQNARIGYFYFCPCVSDGTSSTAINS